MVATVGFEPTLKEF